MNKAITVGLHAMGHHHLGWEEEEFSATWLRQVHVKRHKGLASTRACANERGDEARFGSVDDRSLVVKLL